MLIYHAFNAICNIIIYALLARAILSWIYNPYSSDPNGFLAKLYTIIYKITEPLIIPARGIMNRFNTGQFDFSIFIAMIGIMAVKWIGNFIITVIIY